MRATLHARGTIRLDQEAADVLLQGKRDDLDVSVTWDPSDRFLSIRRSLPGETDVCSLRIYRQSRNSHGFVIIGAYQLVRGQEAVRVSEARQFPVERRGESLVLDRRGSGVDVTRGPAKRWFGR